MRRSVADVLRTLEAEGLATEAAFGPARAALAAEASEALPWYMRAAIGAGAWVATSFLFGSLVVMFDLDAPLVQVLFGLGLVVGSHLLTIERRSEFVHQSSVAASLAGQGIFVAGLYALLDSPRLSAMTYAVIAIVLVWRVDDRVHRFLTTLAFVVALYVVVMDERARRGFELATVVLVALVAVVWRYRVRDRGADVDAMLRPVGYALVVALFAALVVGASTRLGNLSFDTGSWLVTGRFTSLALTGALIALVWKVIDEHDGTLTKPAAFAALAGAALLGATTLSTPGIVAGAATLTLAFDRRDRVLLGMAVVFLIVFGAVYYYSLALTLLEKAGVLAGSGLLLLAIRQRLVRQ